MYKQIFEKANGNPILIEENNDGTFDFDKEKYTDIQPKAGLYDPIYFDDDTRTWVGVTKEEWEENHGVEPQPETEYVTKEEFEKQRKELLAAQEAIAEIYESSLG